MARLEAVVQSLEAVSDALSSLSSVLRGGAPTVSLLSSAKKRGYGVSQVWTMDEYKAFEEAFEEHGYNLEKLCAAVPARPKKMVQAQATLMARARNVAIPHEDEPASPAPQSPAAETSVSEDEAPPTPPPQPAKKSKSDAGPSTPAKAQKSGSQGK